jgi:hypothetical protein
MDETAKLLEKLKFKQKEEKQSGYKDQSPTLSEGKD